MKKMRKRGLVGQIGTEVSEREIKNSVIARKAAAEGFVLLKNDNDVLPIAKDKKVAIYGAGASNTLKGGTGSGDVNERHSVTIYEAFTAAGIEISEPSKKWCESYLKEYEESRIAWRDEILKEIEETGGRFFNVYSQHQYVFPNGDPIDEEEAKSDGADVAFFIVSRVAGEGADRDDIAGDYYLTDGELELLYQVSRCYKDVVLVTNIGGLIDLNFADAIDNVKAILHIVQPGQEGGNAFVDVVTGKVTPSGKMTDTWPKVYEDIPGFDIYSHKNGDVFKEDYTEGIFVGYRYFDTFDVPVRYPFGFGLSYTKFDVSTKSVSISDKGTKSPRASVEVEVKNIGDTFAGKEVVQIYVSCPQGRMVKEYRRLAAFAKTKELTPGESQTLTITFQMYQLASYDEAIASYILEGGDYGIWVGNSIEAAVPAGKINLDKEAVLSVLTNICVREKELDEIIPDSDKLAARVSKDSEAFAVFTAAEVKAEDFITEKITYSETPDTFPGEAGEIVNKLSEDKLIALATGEPAAGQGASTIGAAGQTVPGAAAETTFKVEKDGVASIVLTDGPAGLRLTQEYPVVDGVIFQGGLAFEHGIFNVNPPKYEGNVQYYHQYCTAIPVGTLLAQTWDPELIKEVGEMIGTEMNLFETTLWLAPGMNIHKNPLCGRNFEYYSEDPLVAGIIAAAMTIGVQKVGGCGTTIKHYAANNVEDNRKGSDSIVSERALREIYLKGFEIAIKDSQPMSIMTSYNLINGVHTANSYDLCTKAARDEWGFAGTIMTDWTTTNTSTAGICTAAGCVKAGNDLTMPGMQMDHDSIREALADGSLSINELKACVYRTVKVILQSNQYEEAESYLNQFEGLDEYMVVK